MYSGIYSFIFRIFIYYDDHSNGMKFTTLWVSEKTKQRLLKHGNMKETEDNLINRILDDREAKKK